MVLEFEMRNQYRGKEGEGKREREREGRRRGRERAVEGCRRAVELAAPLPSSTWRAKGGKERERETRLLETSGVHDSKRSGLADTLETFGGLLFHSLAFPPSAPPLGLSELGSNTVSLAAIRWPPMASRGPLFFSFSFPPPLSLPLPFSHHLSVYSGPTHNGSRAYRTILSAD